MAELPHVILYLTDEASNKEYHVEIRSVAADAYRVFIRYGKRGKALREVDESKADQSLEAATKTFDAVCARQARKGYTTDLSGTPFFGTERQTLGRFAVQRHPTESGSITIGSGFLDGFRPADLPQPGYAFLINPNGYDDPDVSTITAKQAMEHFEGYCCDGGLWVLPAAVDASTLVATLKERLLAEATDYRDCDTGGCVATFKLPDGRTLLAALDNGGSDITEATTSGLIKELGVKPELSYSAAHFTLEKCGSDCPQMFAVVQALSATRS